MVIFSASPEAKEELYCWSFNNILSSVRSRNHPVPVLQSWLLWHQRQHFVNSVFGIHVLKLPQSHTEEDESLQIGVSRSAGCCTITPTSAARWAQA